MRDEVVKLTPIRVELGQIGLDQPQVDEGQVPDHLLPLFDWTRGKVNANELTFGQCPRHRRKVGRVPTTDLQDSATAHRSRVEPKEPANDRQPVRVGLRVGVAWINDPVVLGELLIRHKVGPENIQETLDKQGALLDFAFSNPKKNRTSFMAKSSSQKFIARNRAPRVQIEYELETYGSAKKVELPFVMGVMADLTGKPAEPLPAVADRKFLEIDVDNFDDRLKACKPRVAFQVPNTLTGEGNLNVEMTFESMDDFSPAAVARKVDALNKLLQARTELSNLLTYMDGKDKAEQILGKLLENPDLMKSLAAVPNPEAQAAK